MRLRLAGSSLANIARELSVARASVTAVSVGTHRSRRIEAAIAAKLGETPQQLWPERYANASRELPRSGCIEALAKGGASAMT